ncbi:hypothetical protein GGS23DRAFT_587249 [Durotheca rogersii]|uniref:uncharacterized protein n=1 Tax=Durotheca rogersii TaxID=419775 RepID=UPI00222076CB|nr:uncharacterized protein GGS23DRAFT_587249 [Durotheca rogersii]KAI5858240.1 hypothetical protein GGS23DRAFT_587249 [Durotheca rogersii]
MDGSHYILQQCQFEACQSTILLGGPYCTTHGKFFPNFATDASVLHISGQHRQLSSDHRPLHPVMQRSSQPAGEFSKMGSPDKLGDAITVKPPLTATTSGRAGSKKHLPDKHVARKTTSGTTAPKPTPILTAALSDSRSSVVDGASSDHRPAKRPRLSIDVGKGPDARHLHSSFADNNFRGPSSLKPASIEERDPRFTEPSDFALRPKKGNPDLYRPSSQDRRMVPPREPQYENPLRSSPYNYVKSRGISLHPFVDLTADDSALHPSSAARQHDLHGNKRESYGKTLVDPRTYAQELRHDGRPIEVQIGSNRAQSLTAHLGISTAKASIENLNATSRGEPNRCRSVGSSSLTLPHPNKDNTKTIPRPEAVSVSLSSQAPLPALQRKATKDEQEPPQRPQTSVPSEASTEATPQKEQKHRPAEFPAKTPATRDATPHPVNIPKKQEAREATIKDVSVTRIPTGKTDVERHSKEISPSAVSSQKAKEPVNGTVGTSGPIVISQGNGTTAGSQDNIDIPSSKPDILQQAARDTAEETSKETTRGTIKEIKKGINKGITKETTKEATKEMANGIDEQQDAKSPGSPKVQPAPKPLATGLRAPSTEPIIDASQSAKAGGVGKRPAGPSGLASLVQGRSWRHLNPEERRQVWLANHDPDVFDGYIYGKANEPNRPGSSLYGVPDYLQPSRPTRPAARYAHIDPRIHWAQPRSQKWYREKQEEIRERGAKKSNFGKAAARAAQRRREEADNPPRMDLPERVRNNPAWLAAIDELDEIAEQYHLRKRKEHQKRMERRKKRQEKEKQGESNGVANSIDEMEIDPS